MGSDYEQMGETRMKDVHWYPRLGDFGRLGNQLFQVASVIGIAMARVEEFRIQPDWKYRRWLSIPSQFYAYVHPGCPHDGYLQNLSYFQQHGHVIREWFKPSPYGQEQLSRLVAEYGDPSDAVAVHVRCGDYLEMQDLFTCLPTSYYAEAIECLRLAGAPAQRIVLFSDDPKVAVERVRPVLASTPYIVPSWDGPDADMAMLQYMRMCGAHVIANSTFSWWAAWLAGHSHVWSPSRWGEGDFEFQGRAMTIIPDNWRVVEVRR